MGRGQGQGCLTGTAGLAGPCIWQKTAPGRGVRGAKTILGPGVERSSVPPENQTPPPLQMPHPHLKQAVPVSSPAHVALDTAFLGQVQESRPQTSSLRLDPGPMLWLTHHPPGSPWAFFCSLPTRPTQPISSVARQPIGPQVFLFCSLSVSTSPARPSLLRGDRRGCCVAVSPVQCCTVKEGWVRVPRAAAPCMEQSGRSEGGVPATPPTSRWTG